MPLLRVNNPSELIGLVGKEIGVSGWFAMTQQRIEQFAEATEDRQWIHLDRERTKKESPFGGTIAHGFLTLSLISHFVKEVLQIEGGVRLAVNYGLNRVRFPSPVMEGKNIRARVVVSSVKELQDAVEAVFSVTIEGQHSAKPCCIAEWVVRYFS
jgi:acyl dehydratase